MRKSCKAPATFAALSALVLAALFAAAVPAGAAEKPKSDKTTTTTKSDKDAAKSDEDDGSKAGETTTTEAGKEGGKGSTTTTTKAGTKAPGGGVTLTAYGVSVSGGPELAPRPPVRLSSCPATDTGTLPSAEAAGVLKTGAITVVSGCTDSGGAKTVKSRADVSAVVIGTGASALTVGTIASACVANADGNQGGVVLTDLKVAGKSVVVTDVAPNTPLSKLAKGLTGVVNEQVTTGDKLAVNGLRVTQGTADIVLGHVECSMNLTAAVGGPPVVGPTTTKAAKPVATTVAGSKSKKDLANTGKGFSPSLVLALGALFLGILMRVGADGLLVLVPGGRARQRRRQSMATLQRSPAYSWSPRVPGPDASDTGERGQGH